MISEALRVLFPDIEINPDGSGDAVIEQDNQGNEYIAVWNRPEPEPTPAEIDAAYLIWLDGALDRAKTAAIVIVTRQAAAAEDRLDNLLSGHHVRAIILNTEIVTYYEAGRPVDPSPTIYVVANAIATRRDEPLRDTLERLLSKWRDIQADVAAITAELDRLIEEIKVATTEAEIEAVLASAVWP